MSAHTWQFSPTDTWFFRETRPHDAAGGSELSSTFPPSARTVCGAIRTAMGTAAGIDWARYVTDEAETYEVDGVCFRKVFGFTDDLGAMQLTGPFVARRGRPLFPVPAFVMRKTELDGRAVYVKLDIGPAVVTDLNGRLNGSDPDMLPVRLPALAAEHAGAKSLDDTWLTGEGLAAVLRGDLPRSDAFVPADKLFAAEPRLGIALNGQRRSTEPGLLYQTRHLRLSPEVSIMASVAGVDARLHAGLASECRFGGEGRTASVAARRNDVELPAAPAAAESTDGFVLILLTDADLDGRALPPGLTQGERDGARVWTGDINGVPLTVHSAVLGKASRQGGWDLARRRPRDVRCLVPAGSAWFCTAAGLPANEAIARLHGWRIGREQDWGRGLLAAGVWKTE